MLNKPCKLFLPIILSVVFNTTLHSDSVTDWNTAMLNAIRLANTPPPAAARNLAILHASIYDAVNGIRRTFESYLVTGNVPASASTEAAAIAAAYRVLSTLYPGFQSKWAAAYDVALHSVEDGPQKRSGLAWGDYVASAILQSRNNDGSAVTVSFPGGTDPGQWRPTISFGGIVRPALLPQWGSVTPFAVGNPVPFVPPPPPSLGSSQYAADVNQVQTLGSMNSAARTPEQTQIARFWGYGPGTATPAGHWNQIAQEVAFTQRNTLEENARLFALLNIGLADAAIVSWDCKYKYNFWRPITAIQEADTDGNAETSADPAWMPLLETPPFPEYTSGHSTFSGTAAVILASFYGKDEIPFSIGSDDLPGVHRFYSSFSEASRESGVSRSYGGIHFMSANLNGLASGAAVGQFVAAHWLLPKGNRSRN